jgi:hypothetical protein
VYAGHAALALVTKAARPRIPMAVLIPVSFAPDWLQWLFLELGSRNREYSHSIIAVVGFAILSAIAYYFYSQQSADSIAVGLTYLSHWFADLITGIKPTWPGGPEIGLQLYSHIGADVALECAIVVIAWLAYRQSLPPSSRRRAIGFLIPLGLIGMQVGFAAIQQPELKEPLRDLVSLAARAGLD